MKKNEVWFAVMLLVVLAALMQIRCSTQSSEHAEDVCLRMSQEDYDRINEELGGGNNYIEIAKHYEQIQR